MPYSKNSPIIDIMEIPRKYSSLYDIALPSPLGEIFYGKPGDKPRIISVEPGIDRLVRVINGFGMQTTGSCEGHLHNSRYPWVQIAGLQYPDFWVHQEMNRLTQEYRIQKDQEQPIWIVHMWRHNEAMLRTVEEANSEEELVRLRQGANNFADFLFETYLKIPN